MRAKPPTGSEMAAAARSGRLAKTKSVVGKKKGKSVRFTGAVLRRLQSVEQLEDGQFIGLLETETEGDESGLPPGKYNLHLASVNGRWRVFAEAEGKVAGEAVRVKVEKHGWGERKAGPPKFREQGWCLVDICLISVWGFCVLRIQLCCF